MKADADLCRGIFFKIIQQGLHQPEFEGIGVGFFKGGEVVGQAARGAVVGDADQQRAAVGVQEGGDGLGDFLPYLSGEPKILR